MRITAPAHDLLVAAKLREVIDDRAWILDPRSALTSASRLNEDAVVRICMHGRNALNSADPVTASPRSSRAHAV
jgi:hypothetical protein